MGLPCARTEFSIIFPLLILSEFVLQPYQGTWKGGGQPILSFFSFLIELSCFFHQVLSVSDTDYQANWVKETIKHLHHFITLRILILDFHSPHSCPLHLKLLRGMEEGPRTTPRAVSMSSPHLFFVECYLNGHEHHYTLRAPSTHQGQPAGRSLAGCHSSLSHPVSADDKTCVHYRYV